MPTRHPYIPNNPFNHAPGDKNPIRNYDPGVFGGLPSNEQQATVNNMSPSEQADFLSQLMGLGQGFPNSGYSNQIGDLFYSLLGLSGYGGGYGGGGGRGGGGGGGGIPIDYGPELGLERDKLEWAQNILNNSNNNRIGQAMMQQLQMNLAKSGAVRQHKMDTQQLLGSAASRGALTTAGVGTQYTDFNKQFRDALQNMGYQQNLFNLQNQAGDINYLDQTRQNQFGQQGLNIQADRVGYQNPFNIPGPVPVQRKTA